MIKETIGWIVGFLIFCLIVFGIGYLVVSSSNERISYCIENGFEGYETESGWVWEKQYCIRVEGNYKTKQEFERCLDSFCFVLVALDDGGQNGS